MQIDKFAPEVCGKLGFYVYGLIDPRNGRYFYIGKGQGNRVFDHIAEAQSSNAEKDKLKTIREIHNEGFKVIHLILRHGLSDDEAKLVEASFINFIGLDSLTNEQEGVNNYDFGIASAEQLAQKYSCEEFDDKDTLPFMIIKIRQEVLNERNNDLYATCRYAWKISPQKAKDRIVLCVLNGIVKEVFAVEKWQESDIKWRYEFIGKVASKETRDLFINKRIPDHYRKKGMASPVLFSKHS